MRHDDRGIAAFTRSAAVAAGVGAVALAADLAMNAASGTPRWPGPLEWIPEYPWPSLAALVGVSAACGAVGQWHGRKDQRSDRARPARRTISQWDPIELGVHRAIDALIPTYITRHHDAVLRAALDPSVERSRIVVLRGGSSTGKSRAAYLAVADRLPAWAVDFPRTPQLLAARLERGIPPRTVLWLDELRHYADDSDGHEALERLADELPGYDRVIVIAGVWDESWRRYTEKRSAPDSSSDRSLSLLRALPEIQDLPIANPEKGGVIDVPERFDETAIQLALQSGDDGLAKAVGAASESGQAGQIAQYLAGVPALLERYEGPGADPYTRALITAAIDVVRLGHRGLLSDELLVDAAPAYLSNRDQARVHAPAAAWARALAGAAEELRGAVCALEPIAPEDGVGIAGYRLAEFLIQYGSRTRRTVLVPQLLWQAALEHAAGSEDLIALGRTAQRRLIYKYAEQFYRRAQQYGSPIAAKQLADLLAVQGRTDDLRARAATGDLHASRALVGVLVRSDDRAAAEAAYRQAIDAGCIDLNDGLGRLLLGLGRIDEAVLCLRAAHDLKLEGHSNYPLISALVAVGRLDEAKKVAFERADQPFESYTIWHLVEEILKHGNDDDAAEIVSTHRDTPGFWQASVDIGKLAKDDKRQFIELLAGHGAPAARRYLEWERIESASEAELNDLVDSGGPEAQMARIRRAALLASAEREVDLRALAEQGDTSAVDALVDLLATKGRSGEALELVRPYAFGEGLFADLTAGPIFARLVIEEGREDEIQALIESGVGGRTLADWLYEQKRIDDLRRLGRANDPYIRRRLTRLLAELDLEAELADLAGHSNAAATKVQDHRLGQGRADEVYRDAAAGNGYAIDALLQEIESDAPRIPAALLRRSGLTADGALEP